MPAGFQAGDRKQNEAVNQYTEFTPPEQTDTNKCLLPGEFFAC